LKYWLKPRQGIGFEFLHRIGAFEKGLYGLARGFGPRPGEIAACVILDENSQEQSTKKKAPAIAG
jgi:hypothetical protein